MYFKVVSSANIARHVMIYKIDLLVVYETQMIILTMCYIVSGQHVLQLQST